MNAHVFPSDNKTFLIDVRTACDVQTLHFKNRERKLELSKSESRKSEWPNTLIHRPTRFRKQHINQVSLKSVVRTKWVCGTKNRN